MQSYTNALADKMKSKSVQHCSVSLCVGRNAHWYFGVGVNTGIPFKQNISCIILLWSHTHLCRSSFFSVQAQGGKRSEHSSSREAVWSSTPILLKLQFKDRNEIQAGCGYTCGMWVWPEPAYCYLICSVPSLSSQSPISDSFFLNSLNLERKELHFRPGAEWPVASKPKSLLWSLWGFIVGPRPVKVTSSPTTLPFPALPFSGASDTPSMLLPHMLLPLPTKLLPSVSAWPHSDLFGLILISAVPLNLELPWPRHSVSRVPLSVFLHST